MRHAIKVTVIYVLIIIATFAAVWLAMSLMFPRPADNELPEKVITIDFGVVTNVTNCEKRRKNRGLICNVTFDEKKTSRLNLLDFPNDYLKIGDKVHYENRVYERSTNSFYCVNGQCLAQSSCYDTMPCWDKVDR